MGIASLSSAATDPSLKRVWSWSVEIGCGVCALVIPIVATSGCCNVSRTECVEGLL
jgi:hypothetical protein